MRCGALCIVHCALYIADICLDLVDNDQFQIIEGEREKQIPKEKNPLTEYSDTVHAIDIFEERPGSLSHPEPSFRVGVISLLSGGSTLIFNNKGEKGSIKGE